MLSFPVQCLPCVKGLVQAGSQASAFWGWWGLLWQGIGRSSTAAEPLGVGSSAQRCATAGDADGRWAVDLPAEEVPPEMPEPALGINFARDGMQRKVPPAEACGIAVARHTIRLASLIMHCSMWPKHACIMHVTPGHAHLAYISWRGTPFLRIPAGLAVAGGRAQRQLAHSGQLLLRREAGPRGQVRQGLLNSWLTLHATAAVALGPSSHPRMRNTPGTERQVQTRAPTLRILGCMYRVFKFRVLAAGAGRGCSAASTSTPRCTRSSRASTARPLPRSRRAGGSAAACSFW